VADFEIPELQGIPAYPRSSWVPWPQLALRRQAEFQEPLGFPGELVDNWEEVAVEKMGELAGSTAACRSSWTPASSAGPAPTSATITSAPRSQEHAGGAPGPACARSIAATSPSPASTSPSWSARGHDPEVLDEWYSYFHQCSQCRRCSVFCPYGIDTAEISMAAREIMDAVGNGQKYCNEIIGKVYKIGNNLGCPSRRCATPWKVSKRTSGRHRAAGALSARREGRRYCWSPRPRTSSPSRTSTG
jgi:hypothetical protein